MNQKVFDNFPKVKCEECECYWNSTCDGVPEGDERTCTAYRATKTTDIPERLKRLEQRVTVLDKIVMWHSVGFILFGILHILQLIV